MYVCADWHWCAIFCWSYQQNGRIWVAQAEKIKDYCQFLRIVYVGRLLYYEIRFFKQRGQEDLGGSWGSLQERSPLLHDCEPRYPNPKNLPNPHRQERTLRGKIHHRDVKKRETVHRQHVPPKLKVAISDQKGRIKTKKHDLSLRNKDKEVAVIIRKVRSPRTQTQTNHGSVGKLWTNCEVESGEKEQNNRCDEL